MRLNRLAMVTVVLLFGAAAAYPQTLEQMRVNWQDAPVQVDVSTGSGAVDRHARAVIAGHIRPALEKLEGQVGDLDTEVKGIRGDVDDLKTSPSLAQASLATPSGPATTEPSAPAVKKKGGAKMSPWDIFGMIMIVVVVVAGGIVAIIVANSTCRENRRKAAARRARRNRDSAVTASGDQMREIGLGPLPAIEGPIVAEGVIYNQDENGRSLGYVKWGPKEVTIGARLSPAAIPAPLTALAGAPMMVPSAAADTSAVQVPPFVADPNGTTGGAAT